MTNEELEALPIIGDYGMRTEIRNGQKVNIPVPPPPEERSVRWLAPDEKRKAYEDHFGARWEVMDFNGRRVRRRMW